MNIHFSVIMAFLQACLGCNYSLEGVIKQLTLFSTGYRGPDLHDNCIILSNGPDDPEMKIYWVHLGSEYCGMVVRAASQQQAEKLALEKSLGYRNMSHEQACDESELIIREITVEGDFGVLESHYA